MKGFEPTPECWWRARVREHDSVDGSTLLAFDDGYELWFFLDEQSGRAEQQLRNKKGRGPTQAFKLVGKGPQSSVARLSDYELARLENIRRNEAALCSLGLDEAAAKCKVEKSKPTKKRKAPPPSAMLPTRGSRRLAGEKAPDVFVADDEGRQLLLGGDVDEVSALTAERQAEKDAQRREAWAAAGERAACTACPTGPSPMQSSMPIEADFVSLDSSVFHLNTFILSQAVPRENRAFGVFLKLGIATPGFGLLKGETLNLVQKSWPLTPDFQEPLRQRIAQDLKTGPRINDDNPSSEAAQVALWSTHCKPGAFIVCRHAYRENPFMPAALRRNGVYSGDVYVLGRVEAVPPPQSEADQALVSAGQVSDERLAALHMRREYLHGCAKVNYFALGYIDDLSAATRGYISQVCQPTLQQILKGTKQKAAEHTRIRKNLWDCATHRIGAQFSTE